MRLLFLLLIFAPFSAQQAQVSTPWINVFVHGSTKVQWALCSLPKVMLDRIDDNATYSKAVRMVRHNEIFNDLQIIQGLGLKQIDACYNCSCPQLLTALYDRVRNLAEPESTNSYYTFGWSGLCSDKMRYQDAKRFYTELGQEVSRIQQQTGGVPRIRLLGFSHGGNVILNLAAVREQEENLPALKVDEAVLLGMPVLPDTAQLISSNLFTKVYHFYSPADAVQGSDFLSFKRLMSSQRLKKHPDNVVQIRIQLTRYVEGTNRKRPMSPGHIEMWHIGWADWYRPNFPLYPIPVVTLTPQLIAAVQQNPELGNKVTIDMYPQRGYMTLSGKEVSKFDIPFIESSIIEEMKTTALSYKPSKEFFKKSAGHSYDAISFARSSKRGALVKSQREWGSRYKKCGKATCLN